MAELNCERVVWRYRQAPGEEANRFDLAFMKFASH